MQLAPMRKAGPCRPLTRQERQTIDRGTKSFFGAPAVIRNNQAVHTVFDRELRVFARDDAFEEQLDGRGCCLPAGPP
ncbi:MAG: hypothetical protein JWN63_3143 [Candidatus Acidoferrum typicum]|nr:hypothetical protein [Candidatus Acidoferrum typicum]